MLFKIRITIIFRGGSVFMYKYQILANEISQYFDKCRKQGMDSITISALDIEHQFEVSKRCGAKRSSRYPLICQAMHCIPHYVGCAHDGPNPSSTFTVTYNLKKRCIFR